MNDNANSVGTGLGLSIGLVSGSYGYVTDSTSGVVRGYFSIGAGVPSEVVIGVERTYSSGVPSSGWSAPTFNFGFATIVGGQANINIEDPTDKKANSATFSIGVELGLKLSISGTYTTKVIGVDSEIANGLNTPSEVDALNREIGRTLASSTDSSPPGTLDPQQRAELARQDDGTTNDGTPAGGGRADRDQQGFGGEGNDGALSFLFYLVMCSILIGA